MPQKILIPSNADFETAEDVHQKLQKRAKKLNKSSIYPVDFDGEDPSLLSIQLAASCLATLTAAGCGYELKGHAETVLGAEQVVLT